jgi:glutamate dehydrogenase/leucine dehydrogenase
MLAAEGAELILADVDPQALRAAAEATAARVVAPGALLEEKADVLVPASLGGLFTEEVVARLRVKAVCGPANNQLPSAATAEELRSRRIVFAPDVVVNSGGAISAALELALIDTPGYEARIAGIATTLAEVLARADAEGITPSAAAEAVARQRIAG